MLTLSLDTSSKTACVGLLKDGENLANITLTGTKFHSESLIDMVDDALKYQDLKIKDVDLIVVGVGPGSFTGLRIALTVAKTFAQALDIPIVGISSLEAYAFGFKNRDKILPIIDARRERAFFGMYRTSGDEPIETIIEDRLASFDEIRDIIDEDTILVGESADALRESLGARFASTTEILPTDLARLGELKYKEKGSDNYFTLIPNYLNVSQAERQWKQK